MSLIMITEMKRELLSAVDKNKTLFIVFSPANLRGFLFIIYNDSK